MTPQRKLFLDLIAWSEGTSRSQYTRNNGYDVIVAGTNSPNIFTDYSKHPDVLVTVKDGLKSTAAGRYQVLYKYWLAYKSQLGLKGFYPADQDAIAIQMIKECGALADVDAGNVESAITKCRSRWASFPGAGYAGQASHPMATLLAQYDTLKSGGAYV